MVNGFCSYNRFLDGDDKAFGGVVQEYGDRLLYYINTYLKNIAASEDIMEDVFAELVYRRKKFDVENQLKAYIYRAARNKALNYLKKNTRYDSEELSEEIPEDRESLEEHVFSQEKKKLLAECIDGLKDEYREVIYLIYFEDMTYEQAARVMKKNKKQIDNLITRAKAALRVQLERVGVTSPEGFS